MKQKKITQIVLNLPEDEESARHYLKCFDYHGVINEVFYRLIRPYRKHGYPDPDLAKFFDEKSAHFDMLCDFMETFEKKFHEIVNEWDVSID